VVLTYRRPDFPTLVKQFGVVMLLDAEAVGCSVNH
jgi:hypothetical protein